MSCNLARTKLQDITLLFFPKAFSFKKAEEWIKRIPENKIRTCVQNKYREIIKR